jgi:hypothetical protein
LKAEDHPNGFTKIIIGTVFGYRIRLHYWPSSAVKYRSRHNHRWWFISIPLLGAFTDNRYKEVEGDTTMRIQVSDRANVRDSDRVYSLEGNSGLRLKASRTRYPLLPYYCGLGEIHSYYPKGNGPHASLVIISPLKSDTSDIWRDPDELDVELEAAEGAGTESND